MSRLPHYWTQAATFIIYEKQRSPGHDSSYRSSCVIMWTQLNISCTIFVFIYHLLAPHCTTYWISWLIPCVRLQSCGQSSDTWSDSQQAERFIYRTNTAADSFNWISTCLKCEVSLPTLPQYFAKQSMVSLPQMHCRSGDNVEKPPVETKRQARMLRAYRWLPVCLCSSVCRIQGPSSGA